MSGESAPLTQTAEARWARRRAWTMRVFSTLPGANPGGSLCPNGRLPVLPLHRATRYSAFPSAGCGAAFGAPSAEPSAVFCADYPRHRPPYHRPSPIHGRRLPRTSPHGGDDRHGRRTGDELDFASECHRAELRRMRRGTLTAYLYHWLEGHARSARRCLVWLSRRARTGIQQALPE